MELQARKIEDSARAIEEIGAGLPVLVECGNLLVAMSVIVLFQSSADGCAACPPNVQALPVTCAEKSNGVDSVLLRGRTNAIAQLGGLRPVQPIAEVKQSVTRIIICCWDPRHDAYIAHIMCGGSTVRMGDIIHV